jgi:hypothetical protein
VKNALLDIWPEQIQLLEGDDLESEDVLEQIESRLPLFQRPDLEASPRVLSFYLVQKHRRNAFRFFFQMVSHWLVPGKRLDAVFFNAVDFRFPDLSQDVFTLAEMIVRVECEEDLEYVRQNLPIVETDILRGASSSYYAGRILEVKGLSQDEKTTMIQEHIAALLRRQPEVFDSSLLVEMQHMLVSCSDEFKTVRETRHLCRLITLSYLFRRQLAMDIERDAQRRHLHLKILHSRLHLPEGSSTVLGIMVGLNFVKDNESLEERHILKAVQNYVPGVRAVPGSFFTKQVRGESVSTLYLEIEKVGEGEFSSAEIGRLRRALPSDLKDRIEHLMHPVFMPRNEEEVMKNILTLSSQLRYLRDIPQVFISFDQQTDSNLTFTVICARVMKKGTQSIPELFRQSSTRMGFRHDSSRKVGQIRKRYAKEASVFNVRLAKHHFLRRDNSLDLYKARQEVVDELTRGMGPFRDYNGGMISKQNELLCSVRDLLDKDLNNNEFLLENFFYSMSPVVMRTILSPQHLKELFCLQLRILEDGFFDGESYAMRTHFDADAAYAVVTAELPAIREAIAEELDKLHLDSLELATTFVNVYDTPRLGYLLRSTHPDRQAEFLAAIEAGVARVIGKVDLVGV